MSLIPSIKPRIKSLPALKNRLTAFLTTLTELVMFVLIVDTTLLNPFDTMFLIPLTTVVNVFLMAFQADVIKLLIDDIDVLATLRIALNPLVKTFLIAFIADVNKPRIVAHIVEIVPLNEPTNADNPFKSLPHNIN